MEALSVHNDKLHIQADLLKPSSYALDGFKFFKHMAKKSIMITICFNNWDDQKLESDPESSQQHSILKQFSK